MWRDDVLKVLCDNLWTSSYDVFREFNAFVYWVQLNNGTLEQLKLLRNVIYAA